MPVNAEHDAQHVEPSWPPGSRPVDATQSLSARWQPDARSDFAAASAARAWARETLPGLLADPLGDELLDDVELLLGELCTNAVRHGDGLHGVHLHCRPPTVRVTVSDHNLRPPVPYDHTASNGDLHDHGRGLVLVQQIATRWGVEHRGADGKDVWCELPIHRPPNAQA